MNDEHSFYAQVKHNTLELIFDKLSVYTLGDFSFTFPFRRTSRQRRGWGGVGGWEIEGWRVEGAGCVWGGGVQATGEGTTLYSYYKNRLNVEM